MYRRETKRCAYVELCILRRPDQTTTTAAAKSKQKGYYRWKLYKVTLYRWTAAAAANELYTSSTRLPPAAVSYPIADAAQKGPNGTHNSSKWRVPFFIIIFFCSRWNIRPLKESLFRYISPSCSPRWRPDLQRSTKSKSSLIFPYIPLTASVAVSYIKSKYINLTYT